jgi:hypothetical protein
MQVLPLVEADPRVDSKMAWNIAADHKLLAEVDAGLCPYTCSEAGLINTVCFLGDYSFKPV